MEHALALKFCGLDDVGIPKSKHCSAVTCGAWRDAICNEFESLLSKHGSAEKLRRKILRVLKVESDEKVRFSKARQTLLEKDLWRDAIYFGKNGLSRGSIYRVLKKRAKFEDVPEDLRVFKEKTGFFVTKNFFFCTQATYYGAFQAGIMFVEERKEIDEEKTAEDNALDAALDALSKANRRIKQLQRRLKRRKMS